MSKIPITNLQTQTPTALYNDIMEAGGKDRPPMLAPGIDNDIYSHVMLSKMACEMWKAIEWLKQVLTSTTTRMAKIQEVTLDAADNSGPIFDTKPLQNVQNDNDNYNVFANDREHSEQPESVNDTYLEEQDYSLAQECDLLASLIKKLKCEIDDNKNRNKFLESSNKTLVNKLKGKIEDFKTKNKSLESLNNYFKETNNELSKTNQLMFKDPKKFQAELD
ncbi:hypothetical protein Tco_0581826, partial [Tanacetum coccineum]